MTADAFDLDYALAEQSVVGSILVDADCLTAITSVISAGDFLVEANKAIYLAAVQLQEEGTPIDPVTIYERCNGAVSVPYLRELMDIVPTAANAGLYAEQVRKASIRRAIKSLADTLLEQADSHSDPREIIGEATIWLEQLESMDTSKELVSSAEMMKELGKHRAIVDSGKGGLVKTGLRPLDTILGGGLVASGFYILAARPAMGKTTFAIAVAENMAEQGPVLFVTLEMSNAQIAAKRVARESGLSATTLLMGKPTDSERQRANEAVEKLKKSQMHVNRKTFATVSDIASMARKIKGLRCILIDYFGLIRPDTQNKSRYEAYTEISWKLKTLARQLDIPILCLAQLNRENMGRKGNKPALSDLRDTGALEQDADGVLFLHREDYYEDADEKQLNPWEPVQLEIIVAKNRHGGTGVCEAAFFMGAGRIVPTRR